MYELILVQGPLVHLVTVIEDQIYILLHRASVFLQDLFPGCEQKAFIPVASLDLVVPEYQEPVDALIAAGLGLAPETVDPGLPGPCHCTVVIELIGLQPCEMHIVIEIIPVITNIRKHLA